MTDITNKPFYSYTEAIENLMTPIHSQAEVKLIGFTRFFKNRERFLISGADDWAIDFYTARRLYRYGLYEKPLEKLSSRFDMWDHLSYAPSEIYLHMRNHFGFAHGLTIIQTQDGYCDEFNFASQAGNRQINNFYLNQKKLFEEFVVNFSETLGPDLATLEKYRFTVPGDVKQSKPANLTLTKRQQQCTDLIAEGYNTKEVAKILQLSPRTVERHLDYVREKIGAKNRMHLASMLKNMG